MCYFLFLIFSTVLFSHHKYSHQRTIMLCSCLLSARASHLLPVCQLSAPTSPPAAIRIKMLWTCRPLLLADLTRLTQKVIGTCFRSAPVPFSPPLLVSWLRLVYLLTVAPIFLYFRPQNESENSMFGFGAGQYSGSGWLCLTCWHRRASLQPAQASLHRGDTPAPLCLFAQSSMNINIGSRRAKCCTAPG